MRKPNKAKKNINPIGSVTLKVLLLFCSNIQETPGGHLVPRALYAAYVKYRELLLSVMVKARAGVVLQRG